MGQIAMEVYYLKIGSPAGGPPRGRNMVSWPPKRLLSAGSSNVMWDPKCYVFWCHSGATVRLEQGEQI